MNKILNLIFVDWDDAKIFDIKTLLFEETVDMDEVKKRLVENKISTKSCETDNYAFYL